MDSIETLVARLMVRFRDKKIELIQGKKVMLRAPLILVVVTTWVQDYSMKKSITGDQIC